MNKKTADQVVDETDGMCYEEVIGYFDDMQDYEGPVAYCYDEGLEFEWNARRADGSLWLDEDQD